MELKLGQTMKDWTSGFTGLSICLVEHYSGLIRYGIQPKSEDGSKIPDALEVDAHTLEYVDDGRSMNVIAPTGNPDFVLGNEVIDEVTGFVGTAMIRVTHLNGCVYYTVVGKHDSKAIIKEQRQAIEELRLKFHGDGIVKKLSKAAPNPETGKAPGGMSTRMERR
jgi:hypothetical protein